MKTPNFDLTDEESKRIADEIEQAAQESSEETMRFIFAKLKEAGKLNSNVAALSSVRQALFEIAANRLLAANVAERRLKRFESIEARLEQLESELETREWKFLGNYQERKIYKRGHFVTWDGNMWYAQCETAEVPGLSPDWTLAVRRGRNGKDGNRVKP